MIVSAIYILVLIWITARVNMTLLWSARLVYNHLSRRSLLSTKPHLILGSQAETHMCSHRRYPSGRHCPARGSIVPTRGTAMTGWWTTLQTTRTQTMTGSYPSTRTATAYRSASRSWTAWWSCHRWRNQLPPMSSCSQATGKFSSPSAAMCAPCGWSARFSTWPRVGCLVPSFRVEIGGDIELSFRSCVFCWSWACTGF